MIQFDKKAFVRALKSNDQETLNQYLEILDFNIQDETLKEIVFIYWIARHSTNQEIMNDLYCTYKAKIGTEDPYFGKIITASHMYVEKSTYMDSATLIKLQDDGLIDTKQKAKLKSIDIFINNSTILAKEFISLNAQEVYLDNAQISAPDIYLPLKDHVHIYNSELIGNIHYLTPAEFANLE